MTVKLDITQIKKKQMKLYPVILYYLATIVSQHSEFRTAINQESELGICRTLRHFLWRMKMICNDMEVIMQYVMDSISAVL